MKRRNALLLLPFLSSFLYSCNNDNLIVKRYFAFDTMVNVYLYESDSTHFSSIEKMIVETDKMLDTYSNQNGEAYRLNKEKEGEFDGDFISLIKYCITLKDISGGLFNILISPLKELWDPIYSSSSKELPTTDEIDEAVNKISSSSLEIDGNKAKIIGEAKTEFGAIGKGYCLGKIDSYLKDNGVKKYKVDAGSSSVILGESGTEEGFNVKVKNYSNSFKAKNTSISTSSIFEQSQEIEGNIYSHILNPLTGSSSPLHECIVVEAEDPAFGDALSTILMNKTIDEIKEYENDYSFSSMVFDEGKLTYSSIGNEG